MSSKEPGGPGSPFQELKQDLQDLKQDLKELLLPSTVTTEELFLDRLSRAGLERELEASGILDALAARGYGGLSVETERVEGEHRLRVRAAEVETPLVDLRVSELTFVPNSPGLPDHGVEVLYLLAVHWLALQDPRAAFAPERPALPGQAHPGLGIGRRLLARLTAWGYDWGKDAVVNYPRYYHNAIFYSRLFTFLSTRRQGRFEALRRDLDSLTVAEVSWALEQGRVIEEPEGKVVRWRAAEMVAPLTRALKAYLKSEEYCAEVAKVRDAVRFRVQQ